MVRPEANQSGHERWKVLTSIKVAVRSQLNVGRGLSPNPSRPPNIKATALFCGAIHVGQLKFSNASNKKPGPILDFQCASNHQDNTCAKQNTSCQGPGSIDIERMLRCKIGI